MYKLAVIGDRDSILAFKALGVNVYPAVDGNEAKACLLYTSPSPRD